MTSNYFLKNALKQIKKTTVEIFTLNNRLLGNLKICDALNYIYKQIESIFLVILFILFEINFSFFEWFCFFIYLIYLFLLNLLNNLLLIHQGFKILKARAISLMLILCLYLFRIKN